MYAKIIITTLSFVAAASAVTFRDCGIPGVSADISFVTVDGANLGEVNTGLSGLVTEIPYNAVLQQISFKVTLPSATIVPLLGQEIVIPISAGDACSSLTQGNCPVTSGENLTLTTHPALDPVFALFAPAIPFVLETKVTGDNGDLIACVEIDGVTPS